MTIPSELLWQLPSDAALVEHDSAYEGIPKICRTSSSRSTSSGSENACFSLDSDEESQEAEPNILVSVEHHLEQMNAAADEVNEVQEALKARKRHRESLERDWAAGSVHLAKAVGMDHVAKATPYYHQRHHCRVVQRRVEDASSKYQIARVAEFDPDLIQLEAEHAAHLAEYHASKEALKKVKVQSGLSQRALDAVLPYFDALESHRVELAEIGVELQQLALQLNSAKLIYRASLQSLEALSEEAHRQRGVEVASNSEP